MVDWDRKCRVKVEAEIFLYTIGFDTRRRDLIAG